MDVSKEHIEIVDGAFGPKPRIKGRRIRVEDVVGWVEEQGMSMDEIMENFPFITRADVYAADLSDRGERGHSSGRRTRPVGAFGWK